MNLFRFKSFATKLSVYISLMTLIIFSAVMLLFYNSTKERMINNAIRYTHSLLSTMEVKIDDKLNIAETALKNAAWSIEENINTPDSLKDVVKEIVQNNKEIVGSSIAFRENFYADKGKYFMVYASRDSNDIETKVLGSAKYNYFKMDWFSIPMQQKRNGWSEPYFDKGAGNVVMCTYSYPLYDNRGNIYAIFTADISLFDFSMLVAKMKPYESSYTFMLSRKGYYIAHYDHNRIMNATIFSNATNSNNEEYERIGEEMVAGKTGTIEFNNDGESSYAFYTTIPDIGWSICNVCPKDVIFSNLYVTLRYIVLIFVVGAILLFFFTFKIVKKLSKPLEEFSKSAEEISAGNFNYKLPPVTSTDEMQTLHNSFENMQHSLVNYMNELENTAKRQQRIESELQIARSIQQGMLPKIFPPFPDRKDVDISAILLAAKEVGGDLYNFFIDNNKLYFIIGDVSGKGVPASLVMAITSSIFNTIAHGENNPAEIVTRLNKAVCSGNGTNNMFVTLVVGILDLPTGNMRLCNAGHNPPIIVEEGHNAQYIKVEKNLPVGIIQEFEYKEDFLTIPHDTQIILYTDGVTEAENCSNQLYGENRFVKTIEQHLQENINDITNAILKDVEKHVDNYMQSDDLTILAIDYKPQNNASMTWNLIIKNDKQEILRIEAFVEEIGEKLNLAMNTVMNINLALEEAIANIIMYAYPPSESNEIRIFASYKRNELVFLITDTGTAFDPTQVDDADISASLEERKVGGLGIMLIRKIMNEVTYKRIDNTNQLILKKKI